MCQEPQFALVRRFGEKLHTLRTQHNLSTRQLASKLGVSSAYVSYLEHSKAKPGVDVAWRVAQLFNVTADQLLDDTLEV